MGPSNCNSQIVGLKLIQFIAFFNYLSQSCIYGSLTDEKSVMSNQREDLFSSTSKLAEMVDNELQVIDLLDTFSDYVLERAQTIKSYVTEQKRFLMSGQTSGSIVAHPVDAYLLVRRLTADWEDVGLALHGISNYSQGVFMWVEAYREGNNFPRLEDLNGAAQAIVRLQDTYKLTTKSFATGKIRIPSEMSSDSKEFIGFHGLTARDLLFLGKHAFSQGLYNRAIDWLRTAKDIASKDLNSTGILDEIKPSLRSAIEVHDDILERQGPRGVAWKTNPIPINPELAKNAKYKIVSRRVLDFIPKLFQRQTEDEETDHYIRLCRGEKLRGVEIESGLKCVLKSTGSPYLRISPLKIEEESKDPYVVVIHDFVTHEQANHLIRLGKPKLRTSMHGTKNGTFIKSNIRTSKNAWIKDSEDPFMKILTRRVELVTDLKASQPKEAEDYQIANYGLGGLYVPHTDHLMNNPNPEVYTPWEHFVGDRIATLMIYLSDVEGGATVFPRSGITLWPEKGAAAFWWNLDRSGTGDENTRHGACPVLFGDKWVSNKWIRHNEQFQTAQCGLHALGKFTRP